MVAKLKPSPLKPVRLPDDDLTIHYPETDGMPLPDGEYQAPLYRDVVSTLEAYLKLHHPNVAVNGNTFIYYEMNNPRRSVSPDCYVSFGVDVDAITEQNSYIIWRVGKPPDFALEIASESTDATTIPESATCTPASASANTGATTPPAGSSISVRWWASGWWTGSTRNFRYTRNQTEPPGRTAGPGTGFVLDNSRLRFYDPETGEWLQNYAEQIQRADAAETRVRELEERLRQAGIDPSV